MKTISILLCLMFPGTLLAGNYFQGVSPSAVAWPGGIVPYQFDPAYPVTAAESNAIVSGLREWEIAANVKFVAYTNQTNRVILQYDYDGSGTGYYLTGNPGTMMLHGLARGLICHESGHLFGLQHEHQRIDRNNYIVVNLANVAGGSNGEGGFTIDSNSTPFGPYDLVSVMHYGPDSFTNGLGDSLDPLPAYAKYYHKMGNIALSSGDRAAVSNLYGGTLLHLTNVVTNTFDTGAGSLRAALYYADDHPGATVRFTIPTTDPGYSNGVYTISLLGDLPPVLSAGIIIDGTTQPGYAGHPIVVVDGSQAPSAAGETSGLHLYGTNATVRGLAFNDFSFSGIQFFCSDATSNAVQDCYLGISPNGSNAAPNFAAGAIFQFGAHDNTIGGTLSTQRNVISGNTEYGVEINDTNSDRNVILGNYIGLNATGTFGVSNGLSGIGIWDGPAGTIIGGTNSGSGNVLSGNGQYGVFIADTNVFGTTILRNYIGTDVTGNNSIPNGNYVTNSYGGIGLFAGTHDNTIGGITSAARNIISGNTNAGIYISDPGTSNNIVEGNYIGMNAAGSSALTLQQNGILLVNGAASNTVSGNLISGNQQYGIYISDAGTASNAILGNIIGPDATGARAIGDGGFGIGIWNGASANFIGGRNLISGNPGFAYGIAIGSANSNIVEVNFIGTDITLTNALANGFAGVALWGGSTGNVIGSPGAGNVIAYADDAGVVLYDNETTNDSIRGNSIFSNSYLGINFGNNGVAANHIGFEAGPDDLQNFPIITNASIRGTSVAVSGTLNSLAHATYYIDIYRNPSQDSSGHGQGQYYVGSATVATDASGNGTFSFSGTDVHSGQYFSATATSSGGDTSEFDADVLAANLPPAPQFAGPMSLTGGGFNAEVSVTSGQSYHIQATTNLANTNGWTNLTSFTATNSTYNFRDGGAANIRARFYRAVSP